MIKDIKRRIFLALFISTSILIITLGTTAYFVSSRFSFDEYKSEYTSKIVLGKNFYDSKISLNEEILLVLNSNNELLSAIENGTQVPSNTENFLDACRIMTSSLGVYIYSKSKLVSYSSNIFNPIQYNEFIEIDGIKEFINRDDMDSYISIRNNHISQSFQSVNYDKKDGIISLILTLYKDDISIGYIVADFSPSILYSSFEDETLIEVNNQFFQKENISNYSKYLDKSYKEIIRTKDKKYLVFEELADKENIRIYHFNSLENYNREQNIRLLIIISSVVLSIIISFIVSYSISNWINKSLHKIKSSIEDVEYVKE